MPRGGKNERRCTGHHLESASKGKARLPQLVLHLLRRDGGRRGEYVLLSSRQHVERCVQEFGYKDSCDQSSLNSIDKNKT